MSRAEEFLRLLRQELGIEPEAATRALIDAIRGDETPAWIPAPPDSRPEAPALDVSTAAIPAAFRPHRRSFFIAAGIAVIVAVALAGYPLWRSWHAAHAPSAPEASWRPPGILANIGVDQASLAANGISAVLVLPLTAVANSDGGGANRRLTDLITDDLIADLSRLPGIRVIARQTSHFYGGQPVDVPPWAPRSS